MTHITLREAAEQAIEALDSLMIEKGSIYDRAITALRAALDKSQDENEGADSDS